ncbi:MAG: hypothetical protein K0S65_5027, partial [Labilithrix sp.]|nr:hypothetical protein [Labilithrix sp.]
MSTTLVVEGGLAWTRYRTARILAIVFKVIFATVGIPSAIAMYSGLPVVSVLLSLSSFLGWGILIASLVIGAGESRANGRVVLDGDTLVIEPHGGARRAFPRSAIAGATRITRPVATGSGETVEIELAEGDRVTIAVADCATADTLVNALGFGPGGRRTRARIATPTRRLLHLPLGVAAWLFVSVPLFFATVLFGV